MELIIRSSEPDHLLKNRDKWTKPWVDYYKKNRNENGKLLKEKKPTDSYWIHDLIRKILIEDFRNNCGYCGSIRPTPTSEGTRTPRGHVDHYRAKSVYPELTYVWTNYIWSCESCNVEKGEFDDHEHPILNPCELNDCELVEFIIDTGAYCLKKNNKLYYLRFRHTEKKTMINANEIIRKRKNKVKSLIQQFETINKFNKVSKNNDMIYELIKDQIKNILESLKDQEFYFLIQRNYLDLRVEYIDVANLIDNNGP